MPDADRAQTGGEREAREPREPAKTAQIDGESTIRIVPLWNPFQSSGGVHPEWRCAAVIVCPLL